MSTIDIFVNLLKTIVITDIVLIIGLIYLQTFKNEKK